MYLVLSLRDPVALAGRSDIHPSREQISPGIPSLNPIQGRQL